MCVFICDSLNTLQWWCLFRCLAHIRSQVDLAQSLSPNSLRLMPCCWILNMLTLSITAVHSPGQSWLIHHLRYLAVGLCVCVCACRSMSKSVFERVPDSLILQGTVRLIYEVSVQARQPPLCHHHGTGLAFAATLMALE